MPKPNPKPAAPKPKPKRKLPGLDRLRDAVARERYLRLVEQIGTHGFTLPDSEDLAVVYAQAYADFVRANREVSEKGYLARDGRGNVVENPWLGVRDEARRTMETTGRSLGVRPDMPVASLPPWSHFVDVLKNELGLE